jgi:hypothetical protein
MTPAWWPPLDIPEEQLGRALDVLDEVLGLIESSAWH